MKNLEEKRPSREGTPSSAAAQMIVIPKHKELPNYLIIQIRQKLMDAGFTPDKVFVEKNKTL
ncbi:MAG: hypothetical protein A2007_02490 [Verrucomicrobia bacterium GWC2_42_7]|nr:MAG: hypothetical protein A2007_02490 [Verrucomicrobia bacterium GWC2_42_7]